MYLWKAAVHLIFFKSTMTSVQCCLPPEKSLKIIRWVEVRPLTLSWFLYSLSFISSVRSTIISLFSISLNKKKDDEENLGLVRLNATWGPCNGGLFNCVVVLKLLWPAESFFFLVLVWSMTTIKPSSLKEESRPHSMCGDLFTTVYWDLLLSLSKKIERWTTCAAPVRYSRLSLTDLLTSVEKRRITPQSDCWRSVLSFQLCSKLTSNKTHNR